MKLPCSTGWKDEDEAEFLDWVDSNPFDGGYMELYKWLGDEPSVNHAWTPLSANFYTAEVKFSRWGSKNSIFTPNSPN